MANTHFNFTERALDKWFQDTLEQFTTDPETLPAYGETSARDRGGAKSVPGLYLRLRLRREGEKFSLEDPFLGFYLIKKVQGKKRTLLLGDRKTDSVEMARTKALEEVRNLKRGVGQRAERKRDAQDQKLHGITYRTALQNFLVQAHGLRERTKKQYRASLHLTFKGTADRPLVWFNEKRLRVIHGNRSKETMAGANLDLRTFRLIWNWARDTYKTEAGEPYLGPNPVSQALNKKRRAGDQGWNTIPRRQRVVPETRLPDWFGALSDIRTDPSSSQVRVRSCDLLEALALTGLRFSELARLSWGDIDPGLGVLTVPDHTAKNRKPLVRPLTRRIREILEAQDTREGWVFPGQRKGKPIDNTRKLQEEVRTRTGLWITPHDLRRGFASGALRAGVPMTALKRLFHHTSGNGGGDVTEGYQVTGLESLREYAQKTEDYILGKAGLLTSSGLDHQLQDLLVSLPEGEKRRLLSQLSQQQAQGVK